MRSGLDLPRMWRGSEDHAQSTRYARGVDAQRVDEGQDIQAVVVAWRRYPGKALLHSFQKRGYEILEIVAVYVFETGTNLPPGLLFGLRTPVSCSLTVVTSSRLSWPARSRSRVFCRQTESPWQAGHYH